MYTKMVVVVHFKRPVPYIILTQLTHQYQCGFDAATQFRERITSYVVNGHPVDKIEVLVLGGTWSEYPHAYQKEFVRCVCVFYYCCKSLPCCQSNMDVLSSRESNDMQ